MDKEIFYRDCFLRSAEKLIGADAECTAMATHLAKLKEDYIVKNLIGKTFSKDTLMTDKEHYYKYHADGRYKAIHVKSSVTASMCMAVQNRKFYTDIINISIYFLLDPQTILDGKMRLTDKEKVILKKMCRYYNTREGENGRISYNNCESIDTLQDELLQLKHRICIMREFRWSYDMPSIMDEKFVSNGLRANLKIL